MMDREASLQPNDCNGIIATPKICDTNSEFKTKSSQGSHQVQPSCPTIIPAVPTAPTSSSSFTASLPGSVASESKHAPCAASVSIAASGTDSALTVSSVAAMAGLAAQTAAESKLPARMESSNSQLGKRPAGKESPPPPSDALPGGAARRVVRSRTPSACVRCKAAKAKCSEQRPCPRCLRSGDAVACAAELGPGANRPVCCRPAHRLQTPCPCQLVR